MELFNGSIFRKVQFFRLLSFCLLSIAVLSALMPVLLKKFNTRLANLATQGLATPKQIGSSPNKTEQTTKGDMDAKRIRLRENHGSPKHHLSRLAKALLS